MSSGGTVAGERVYGNKTAAERRHERRQRLLDAGLELFATTGYANTTVQELCGAAGVSARTFYEEFDNREDLLVELHDQLNARAFDTVVTAVAAFPVTQFEQRAAAGVRAYFEVMTADPRWARIALVESVGVNDAVDGHRRAAIDRFAELIDAQLRLTAAEGLIPDRDFALTATGLVGALNELVMTYGSRDDWADVAEAVIAEGNRFVLAVANAS